ncbi:MAG: MFS transporter [Clostridia bacterium]|nr:MFS transporter [Clostridia bacterium]
MIFALCFITVFTTLGFCSSNRTVYLTAITDALGLKRSAFSLNDTFRYVTTTVLNIFFGSLIFKFGAKKLICLGFGCLIGFALLNSYAESLIVFYIAGILLGVGLSWCGTSMMSYIASKWCNDKNRGAVTGAILSANGLGGAVAVQIITPIIFEEGNPFGYRNSYKLVAIILAVVLALIIIFFKEAPKGTEKSTAPIKKTKKARGGGWVGMDFALAIKKPYFYLALICMAFTGMALQGISGIATPHMYDLGIDKTYVATLMTVSSLCLMGCKFLTGFMYDKMGIKITMNVAFFSSFLSLLGLVLISNTPLGRAIALVRIIFASIAMPLETVMISFFASELFGNKSFAKILGLFSAASTAGFAVGAPFANFCFDIFGDYNVAFIVFACLMIFVTVTMQFVVKLAHRDRNIIIESGGKEELVAQD